MRLVNVLTALCLLLLFIYAMTLDMFILFTSYFITV